MKTYTIVVENTVSEFFEKIALHSGKPVSEVIYDVLREKVNDAKIVEKV